MWYCYFYLSKISVYFFHHCNKLNKLVRKAGSVFGVELDNLEVVVEGRMRRKLDDFLMICW